MGLAEVFLNLEQMASLRVIVIPSYDLLAYSFIHLTSIS